MQQNKNGIYVLRQTDAEREREKENGSKRRRKKKSVNEIVLAVHRNAEHISKSQLVSMSVFIT